MSQGNMFSSLQYRPDLSSIRPYFLSVPENIASNFQSIGRPVPNGFESFNAVAEAYDLKNSLITYFFINIYWKKKFIILCWGVGEYKIFKKRVNLQSSR